MRWLFPVIGLVSLVWFLVRVLPKPSRATYPCQRVAAPLASGFVVWLVGLVGSVAALHGARVFFRQWRLVLGGVCLTMAAVAGVTALVNMPEKAAVAAPPIPNQPIGDGEGIHPGRVVWVYDPDATDWDGVGRYWAEGYVEQAVVDSMMSRAIQALAGRSSDAEAWGAIFRQFNLTHRGQDVGYQPGERIAIKVNLVASVRTYVPSDECIDETTYAHKTDCRDKEVNTSAEMMLALLRQLVYTVGVAEEDISIGDTIAYFAKHLWDVIHPEFPGVVCFDGRGLLGRTLAQPSTDRIYWSDGGTARNNDYMPQLYAQATYFINMPNLKGHEGGGVTLSGKNHYGSLCHRPDASGYYSNMHGALPYMTPGYGRYRTLVDLLGHRDTGGKGLLYIVDGLWSTRDAVYRPMRWYTPPFNGDWPSSLFVSQDPVAIDSVGFDFLLAEWPNDFPGTVNGADDYLHQAASSANWPAGISYDPDGDGTPIGSLGVHEHWNNATDKKYSRNLGTGEGIELIAITPAPPPRGDLDGDGDVDLDDWRQMEAAPMTGPVGAIQVMAFSEAGGLVVMEAENYHEAVPANGYNDAWTLQGGGGAYGSDRMASLPNDGDGFDPPHVAPLAPRMSYYVQFTTPGTYYLWVRGSGPDGSSDSVHYGVNNQVVSTGYSDAPKLNIGSLAWTGQGGGGVRSMVEIPAPGVYAIDIWVREDGAVVDRFLLTTASGYTPTGDGPAESPQVSAETWPVPRQAVAADLDEDGDCDLADLAILAGEFTGPQ